MSKRRWFSRALPVAYRKSQPLRNRRWFPAFVSVVIAITVYFCCQWVRQRGWLQRLELYAYDKALLHRPKDARYADQVVVIGITESDLYEGGFHYPITDAEMAELLHAVLAHKPMSIGVDIYRDRPEPPLEYLKTRQGRDDLEEIWRKNFRVINVMLLATDSKSDRRTFVPPPTGLRGNQYGFADWVTDRDDVVRRGLFFQGLPDQQHPEQLKTYVSLAAWVSRLYLKLAHNVVLKPLSTDKEFELGKSTLHHFRADDGGYVGADDRGVQYMLDYRSPLPGSPDYFKHFTASDIRAGRFEDKDFAGKVVLIGMTAGSVKDYLSTPAYGRVFGVEVHAAAVHQMIRMALLGQLPVRLWPKWKEQGYCLLWSLLGAALGLLIRRPYALGPVLGVGIVALGMLAYLPMRSAAGIWVPLIPPAITWVSSAAMVTGYVSFRERSDRLALRNLFERHVDREVVDELWKKRHELIDHGRLVPDVVTATILFSDLRGFTAMTERLSDPDLVIRRLNDVMGPLSDVVYSSKGMIRQYAGDAIMALFGVPAREGVDAKQAACNAVTCALRMREAFGPLRYESADSKHPLELRIGIYTGPVVVGSIGGEQRLEYTVIGDTVNTASRLESMDKDWRVPESFRDGCRILIGKPTHELLDPALFVTHDLGKHAVHGRREPVHVFGVSAFVTSGRAPEPGLCPPQPELHGAGGPGSHRS